MEVTAMMVEAAKNGEAKWTYKGGYMVAGKTGTAQIPIEGHYDEDKTLARYFRNQLCNYQDRSQISL